MEWCNERNEALNHLTQWETGRKVNIKGLEAEKTYKAHIFNSCSEKADRVNCENVNGEISFIIPDILLQTAYSITVIIHEVTKDSSIAIGRMDIPVSDAKMPEDYVYVAPDRPDPGTGYILPMATAEKLGGIYADPTTGEYTVLAKIGPDGKIYVPKYPDNYSDLKNKPSINGHELNGNQTAIQLGLQPKGNYLTEHQDISGKADKTEIPTKTSDLVNDSGYLTKHQDISGKADKAEVPKKTSDLLNDNQYQTVLQVQNTVDQAIKGVSQFTYEKVSTLPQTGEKGKIYLKASEIAADKNIYDEYIWIDNAFEMIGTTKIDLSGYVTDIQLEEKLKTKLNTTDISEWAKNPTKPTYTAKEVGALPEGAVIPKKTSELTNDSGFLTEHQDVSGKLDKNQGSQHNGKILGINELGDVIPVENAGEVIDVDAELKEYMKAVKPAIASAIVEKGGNATVQDAFGTYPDKIRAIPNGVSPTETLPKQTTLIAVATASGINLKWKDVKATGYVVVRKENIVPATVVDGTEIYRGTGISYSDSTAIKGYHYYYRIFPFNEKNQYQTLLGESVSDVNYIDRTGMKTIGELEVNSELIMGEKDGNPIRWVLLDNAFVKSTGIVSFGTKSGIGNYQFDAPENEPGNANPVGARASYGNNRWSLSNIRQWLNSNGLKNEWFAKTHQYDMPPNYKNQDGFLTNFNDYELSIIIEKESKTFLAAADDGGFETVLDKFWLIGNFEAGFDTNFVDNDHIFNGLDSQEKRKFEANYWTREINDVNNPTYVRYGNASGSWGNYFASIGIYAVRPFCQIAEGTYVSWSDELHAYILADDSQRYPRV